MAYNSGCKRRKRVRIGRVNKDNEKEETLAVPTTMKPMEKERRKAMRRKIMREKIREKRNWEIWT